MRNPKKKNVKRKKNNENNPCTIPTINIYRKKLILIISRDRVLRLQLQRVPLGSRYPWGLNLLSLDTAAGKEVTKEGRDVSGLGAREGLVVRGCSPCTCPPGKKPVENGNKQNSVLTSFWVCQSSSVLGPS